jgi:hypothetical protein
MIDSKHRGSSPQHVWPSADFQAARSTLFHAPAATRLCLKLQEVCRARRP